MPERSTPAIAPESELVRRALAAYFRGANSEAHASAQPSADGSGTVEHDGKLYVVLVDGGNDVLAVYRVRNDGVLKGLRRWPKAIEPPRFGESP